MKKCILLAAIFTMVIVFTACGSASATKQELPEAHTTAQESVDSTKSVKELHEVAEKTKYYLSKKTEYDSNGKITWYAIYVYDANGNELSYMAFSGDGSLEVHYEETYDDLGQLLKTISYNDDGTIYYTRDYTYDSKGNKLTCYYSRKGGTSSLTTYEYDMDEKGNVYRRREFIDGILDEEINYNTDGYEQLKTYYYPDGSLSGQTECDSMGNEISYISYNRDGSIEYWVESTFDSYGNEISEIENDSDGEKTTTETSYAYDLDGNILEALQKETISKDGEDYYWSESTFVGQYNSDGKLVIAETTRAATYSKDVFYPIKNKTVNTWDSHGNVIRVDNYNDSGVLDSYTTYEYIPISTQQ